MNVEISDPIEEALEKVPDYKVFMTVDELDDSTLRLREKYPDIVNMFEIGKTRDGDRIYAIKIGRGRLNALLFGCPHPNEPVGTLMLDYLSWLLAEDDRLRDLLNYTFYIVKVADKDGLRLNEGWLKKPFTILTYTLNYYRPAGNMQVEWTFPIKYKKLNFNSPIPETKALMRIIEDIKPDFIYSLHNSGFGGVYYYITEEALLLYPIYKSYPRQLGIPLALGEPEVPYATKLSDAIYYMFSTPEYYDYLEKHADRDPSKIIKTGTDSYDYSKRYNPHVFELVTEVPYLYDPRVEDQGETQIIRRKAVLDYIDYVKREYNMVKNVYDNVRGRLKLYTRFREAMEYFLEVFPHAIIAEENWAKTAPELERKATVAEVFDNYTVSKFYRLLILGQLRRMLLEEVKGGNDGSIERELRLVEDEIYNRADQLEGELEYEVIPIRKLVKIQLAAGLYTMLYIQTRKG